MAAAASEKGGYVKLISSDKHVFIVERRVASVSGRLRALFSGSGVEAGKGEVSLEFPAPVVEKVCQYFVRGSLWDVFSAPPPPRLCTFVAPVSCAPQCALLRRRSRAPPPLSPPQHYKIKHTGSKTPAPEFNMPAELALQVLQAADYLEC